MTNEEKTAARTALLAMKSAAQNDRHGIEDAKIAGVPVRYRARNSNNWTIRGKSTRDIKAAVRLVSLLAL
jgi:hypothetical protein